ncbi:hypothetical protein GVAV_001578 [Gurleya vavrai]
MINLKLIIVYIHEQFVKKKITKEIDGTMKQIVTGTPGNLSLNPVLLYGKKGLIQRAVDSYRSIAKEHSRIIKSDKIVNGVLRRRFSDLAPRTVSIFGILEDVLEKVG